MTFDGAGNSGILAAGGLSFAGVVCGTCVPRLVTDASAPDCVTMLGVWTSEGEPMVNCHPVVALGIVFIMPQPDSSNTAGKKTPLVILDPFPLIRRATG